MQRDNNASRGEGIYLVRRRDKKDEQSGGMQIEREQKKGCSGADEEENVGSGGTNSRRQVFSVKNSVNLSHSSLLLPLLLQSQ